MNEQKQTNEEQVSEQAQVNEQEKVYVQPQPKPIKSWVKKVLISFVVVIFTMSVFTAFTRMGYIPNFLDIEILCPANKNDDLPPLKMKISCESQGKMITRDCGVLADGMHCGSWKCVDKGYESPDFKPVIYLYPTKKQDVEVRLDYKGEIFADYPEYNEEIKGWRVLAYPDGKLINYADDKEYSYLFWEGNPSEKIDYDLSSGFVVKGDETKKFLQKTLSQMGLTPKEYNEFIVYWFPKMQDNAYNLIHFAHEKYTDNAPLTIIPKPDSMLRVFMVFKPLKKPVEIEKQKLEHFERKGFSVIEWGGTEMK